MQDYKQPLSYPKRGQFVAIWTYDNKVWSETYIWINYRLNLLSFNPYTGDITPVEEELPAQPWYHMEGVSNVKYFQLS